MGDAIVGRTKRPRSLVFGRVIDEVAPTASLHGRHWYDHTPSHPQVPAVQLVCGTAALPPPYWGIAIGWSAAIFALAEVRKWALFLWPKSWFARAFYF